MFYINKFNLDFLIRKFLTWKCFTQGSRETLIGWKDSGGWSEFKERRAHKRMKKCCIPIFFNKYWFTPIFISWIYIWQDFGYMGMNKHIWKVLILYLELVQITKYICSNCKIYLFTLQNIFVQILKKIYWFKLQNIFV